MSPAKAVAPGSLNSRTCACSMSKSLGLPLCRTCFNALSPAVAELIDSCYGLGFPAALAELRERGRVR
jgi:hypothetical protein